MKRIIKVLSPIFSFFFIAGFYFQQGIYAQSSVAGDTKPMRLSSFEGVFIHVMIVAWALSIFYFMFVVIMIGVKWMLSQGDENKLAGLKQRGGNVVLAMGMVFGGYIIVRLIMSLLGFKDPSSDSGGKCLETGLKDQIPFFKFFFPQVCTGE